MNKFHPFILFYLCTTALAWADEFPEALRGMYFMDPEESMVLLQTNPKYQPEHKELIRQALVKRSKKVWIRIASTFFEIGNGKNSQKIDLITLTQEDEKITVQLGQTKHPTEMDIIPLKGNLFRFFSHENKDNNYFAWKRQSGFNQQNQSSKNKEGLKTLHDSSGSTYISWSR